MQGHGVVARIVTPWLLLVVPLAKGEGTHG